MDSFELITCDSDSKKSILLRLNCFSQNIFPKLQINRGKICQVKVNRMYRVGKVVAMKVTVKVWKWVSSDSIARCTSTSHSNTINKQDHYQLWGGLCRNMGLREWHIVIFPLLKPNRRECKVVYAYYKCICLSTFYPFIFFSYFYICQFILFDSIHLSIL